MDQNESIVNLDEESGDTPIISHNSSHQNLLLAGVSVDANSSGLLAPSGAESGLSSPMPEPAAPLHPSVLDEQRKSGDALIHDVIEQLETQCSVIIPPDEPPVPGVPSPIPSTLDNSNLPPASSLFSEPTKISTDFFQQEVKHAVEERRNSIWIPSFKTRETLSKLPQSDKRLCYTMPGVMVEESMGDPVRDLLKKHVSELEAVKRASKTSSTPENLDGLRNLINDGNYRSAIDLTAKLLKNLGQGFGAAHKHSRNSEESLKLWSVRLQMFVAIGQYNLAASELEPFGNLDSPDLYYEYYPEVYRGKKGSLVPFEMRLLHAEMPRLIGQTAESLTRISRVVEIVKKILFNLQQGYIEDEAEINASVELWNCRLVKTYKVFARCLLSLREYRSVLDVSEKIVALCESEKCVTYGAMGRLCLQLGDFATASVYFQKFAALSSNNPMIKSSIALHAGFCFVFNNNYVDALQAFQKVIELDPAEVSAANNAAVCMLYLGRLQDAVNLLESLIRTHPKSSLQESICTNLCTLYELASARSSQKKINLLNLVSEYHGDGFNPSCLKLSA